jgi:hypothetical protein
MKLCRRLKPSNVDIVMSFTEYEMIIKNIKIKIPGL